MVTEKRQVGETVILKRNYGVFEMAVVTHVTDSGRFRISANEDWLFRPDGVVLGGDKFGRGPRPDVLDATQANLDLMAAQKASKEESDKAKQARNNLHKITWLERAAACLRHAKANVILTAENHTISHMPDGSEFHVVHLPVREGEKGGWEVLVLTIRPMSKNWLDESDSFEYSYTWSNGASGSYPSCGSERATSREAALWTSISQVYNR